MAAPVIDETAIWPESLNTAIRGGARFRTTLVESGSGTDQATIHWDLPKGFWVVDHDLLRPEHAETLNDFFHARRGRGRGFRFKNWLDYRVLATAPHLTIAAPGGGYQLVKRYGTGASELVKKIYKPVSGTVRLWNGATEITTGWTVDTATGIVTYGGGAPSASFEYHVPVRFASDSMELSIHDGVLRAWQNVELVEMKGTDD